jgi:nucleoside-diphosphate-sugar epimerase
MKKHCDAYAIIGLGYVGLHVAAYLAEQGASLQLYSRKDKKSRPATATFHYLDLEAEAMPELRIDAPTVIITVPTSNSQTEQDLNIVRLLNLLATPPKHIVYLSTSGVYGDCQGEWVDESYTPKPQFPRLRRRLDAEQQLTHYCQTHGTALSLLRVASIYGIGRLPLRAVRVGDPIIDPEQAPIINHIHIDDLVTVIYQVIQKPNAIQIYNVADGSPEPMGTMKSLLADFLDLPPLPLMSYDEALDDASSMMMEFLQSSRCLKIDKMKKQLKIKLKYPDLATGLEACLATDID